jgi:hypothetical protein
MNGLPWIQILNGALIGFLVLGFFINTFAVKVVGAEYRRWGYPDWFHFVSGSMELAAPFIVFVLLTIVGWATMVGWLTMDGQPVL